MKPMRDYQVRGFQQLREAVAEGYRRIVFQSPTGSGKTRLAAEIVNGARGKQRKVIFEVPAISLVDQTVEAFYAEGITDVGVIQANHHMTDWSQPIQVASVQTLQNTDVPRADVVIRDEAHKMFKFDLAWMLRDEWRKVPFIGLTATPWTKGIGRVYEKLIIGSTFAELIGLKVLAPFRVFAPSHPDLKGVCTVAGDYHEGELSAAMQKGKLCADIVETWKRMAEGRPTICFGVDRAHAKALQERFAAADVPAAYMDAHTGLYERKEIRDDCRAGRVKVVCNVDVMGFGMDWPWVSCISYCRPTKSEIRFVQNIGRGLRICEGKDDLLVLDHSDTHLRLGFVTEIEHSELPSGRTSVTSTEPRVRLPKECPSCGYLKSYGVTLCPNCGVKTLPPPSVKEDVKAQLGQFNGKKSHRKGDEYTSGQKLLFLAELKAYALAREFKIGWVFHKYEARMGVKPAVSVDRVEPAKTISAATMQWIKSQNIRWRMGKAKEEQSRVGSAQPFVEAALNGAAMVSDDGTVSQPIDERSGFVQGTLLTEADLRDAEGGL